MRRPRSRAAKWHKARGLAGKLRNQCLMTVADHGRDPGQRGDLLRRPLSVTPRNQDARGRILPVHSAQESAGGAVRLRGHTAGVGDDHVCLAGIDCRGQAGMSQLGANDFAVRPAGPTSEVLNVVFCHVASVITWVDCRSNEPNFR